ncbi:MAG: pyridoxamine 5'-phosphate oxidase family protein [Oscillospiraceae bacterium]
METVLKFFKDNPVFYLATVEGDQPRVRPFGAIAQYDGKLYLCTNSTKDVYKQLKKNPKVELSGTSAEGDSWLRVAAVLQRDTTREAKVAMLEDNPGLKNMYGPDDGIFEVFYLKDAVASFSSFTGQPKTVRF